MPGKRKRRKSRKHSLVFTESPVHNQKHPQTPVLCVDNPVTAKRVPVDQDTSWVSPQFHVIQNGKCDNKYIRKYHSTMTTRSRHPSNKENKSFHHKTSYYREKYKSLKFHGDTSVESIDDISFNSPSPVATRKLSSVSKQTVNTPVRQTDSSWSLEKLKKSKKAFNISFSDSLNIPTPNVRHMNHTLNISAETQLDKGSSVINNKHGECVACVTPTCRRSSRLQSKYLQACGLFQTPPNREDVDIKILVQDTPECDYNLTIRGKQLRQKLGGNIS